MRAFLFDRLDLTGITLVCQDWGGLIGLRLVGEHPDRFARVVAANTFLPTGDVSPGEAFFNWQRFSQEVEVFPTGFIVNSGCVTALAPEVQAAYDAPFPDESFKAGARAFPMLVPSSPDDPAHDANVAAWKGLASYARPFLTAFGDADPITRGAHRALQEGIAGARGQPHTTIVGGGHFLQEDCGEELARVVVDFVAASDVAATRAARAPTCARHERRSVRVASRTARPQSTTAKTASAPISGRTALKPGVVVDQPDERIHGPGLGHGVTDGAHGAAHHIERIDATTEHAGGDADDHRRGDGLLLAAGPRADEHRGAREGESEESDDGANGQGIAPVHAEEDPPEQEQADRLRRGDDEKAEDLGGDNGSLPHRGRGQSAQDAEAA